MTDPSKRKARPSSIQGGEEPETLKDKAKDAVAEAADKVKELAAAARDKAKDVAAATGELTAQAKERVQEWTVTAADKTEGAVQDLAQELTSLVRRYPIPSLLVGFAVGFLLARTTTRS
jgi:ElaB/YqjD/DUF883 family membrane-anchored ribosome-binding protein